MKKLSLLLVEGNQEDERFTLQALNVLGLNDVTVARDGLTAVSLLHGAGLEGPSSLPDLILLDLRLPKLNGLEVLRKIRSEKATAELNVVTLSTIEDPEILHACRSLGALACLPKPLVKERLLPVLKSLPQSWPFGRHAQG